MEGAFVLMKGMLIRYKSFILYAVFGVLTTIVNIATYYIFAHIVRLDTVVSTCLAWISGVLFAYITNRKYVFESDKIGVEAIVKEMISFFSCRLATGVVDVLLMYIFVDLLKFNDVFIKVFSNVVVIVLNYVASKLIIFRKDKG